MSTFTPLMGTRDEPGDLRAYAVEMETLVVGAKKAADQWRYIANEMGYGPDAHKHPPLSPWLQERVAKFRARAVAETMAALPKEGEEAIRARAFEEAAALLDAMEESVGDNVGDLSDAYSSGAHAIRNLSSLPVSGEVERLTECLRKANASAERFERECYLRGDELEKLRDALEPFARSEVWAHLQDDEPLTSGSACGITVNAGHFRRARAALTPQQGTDSGDQATDDQPPEGWPNYGQDPKGREDGEL